MRFPSVNGAWLAWNPWKDWQFALCRSHMKTPSMFLCVNIQTVTKVLTIGCRCRWLPKQYLLVEFLTTWRNRMEKIPVCSHCFSYWDLIVVWLDVDFVYNPNPRGLPRCNYPGCDQFADYYIPLHIVTAAALQGRPPKHSRE